MAQPAVKINPQPDAPSVTVLRLQPKAKCSGYFKASADIQVDNLWAICGLQVVESCSGLEVFWPTNHDYNYTVEPLNLSLKRGIEDAVIDAWQASAVGSAA